MSLLDKFIAFLEEQAKNHSIYVWGGQGETGSTITEAWITLREKTSSNPATNASRAIAYWKKQIAAGYGNVLRAFDCSGLGIYWLKNVMGLYKSDMSANSMMGKCKKIIRSELKRGDWVFRVDSGGKANHIGYIVDNKLNVIEAKGRDDGVIKRSLDGNGKTYWNAYGRPDVFKDEIAETTPSQPTTSPVRLLKFTNPYMRGDDVKTLQQALNKAGCNCGTVDGIFGMNTDAAVKRYQDMKGLVVDGIVGEKTRKALGI